MARETWRLARIIKQCNISDGATKYTCKRNTLVERPMVGQHSRLGGSCFRDLGLSARVILDGQSLAGLRIGVQLRRGPAQPLGLLVGRASELGSIGGLWNCFRGVLPRHSKKCELGATKGLVDFNLHRLGGARCGHLVGRSSGPGHKSFLPLLHDRSCLWHPDGGAGFEPSATAKAVPENAAVVTGSLGNAPGGWPDCPGGAGYGGGSRGGPGGVPTEDLCAATPY